MKKILRFFVILGAAVLVAGGSFSVATHAASKTPAKVTLVSVSTKNETSVQLTWKPVKNVDGYHIYRKGATGSFKKVATVKGAAQSTYTAKKLKKGTIYSFTVKAYKGKKEGKFDKKGLKACTAVAIKPSTKPYKNQYVKNKSLYNASTRSYWTIRSYMTLFEGLDSSMLILKKGTYNMPSSIWVPSNTTVVLNDGVTIDKTSKTDGAAVNVPTRLFLFMNQSKSAKSNAAKGYNSVQNASVIGKGKAVINVKTKNGVAFGTAHCKNITISGITINLKSADTRAIHVLGSSGVKITDCTLASSRDDTRGICIEIPASKTAKDYPWSKADDTICKNINISKCTFKGLRYSIYTTRFMKNKYEENITVDSCKFKNCKEDGIRVLNWKNFKITNNKFDTVGEGAKCVSGPKVAIRLYGANNPTIRGNTFDKVSRTITTNVVKNTDSKLSGQGYTATTISAAAYKMMTDQNTIKALGDYFITENKKNGDIVRHWFPDNTRSYTMKPGDVPYRNQNVLQEDYVNSQTSSKMSAEQKKAVRQYYTLRSYLEQIERNGGGTLTLASGDYLLSTRVIIPSNTTLILSKNVTIKTANEEEGGTPIFYLLNRKDQLAGTKYTKNNGVHDVVIQGPADGSATIDKDYHGGSVFTIVHAKNVTIQNIAFRHSRGGAHFIELDASDNVTIDHCYFADVETNDVRKGAINIDIPDVNTDGLVNCYYSSYDCTPDTNVTISNNTFKNVSMAVESHNHTPGSSPKNIVIKDNVMDTYHYAIRARNWTDPVITGNTITVHADKVKNSVSALCPAGILLEGVTNPTVSHNTVAGYGATNPYPYFMKIMTAGYDHTTNSWKKRVAKHPDFASYADIPTTLNQKNLDSFLDGNTVTGSETHPEIRYYDTYWSLLDPDTSGWDISSQNSEVEDDD